MSRITNVNSTMTPSKRVAGVKVRGERGDTLIEVLMALLVLSLCALAIMIAFSTSISASQQHRDLATANIVLASASQQAIAQIQQDRKSLRLFCADPEPAGHRDHVRPGQCADHASAELRQLHRNGVQRRVLERLDIPTRLHSTPRPSAGSHHRSQRHRWAVLQHVRRRPAVRESWRCEQLE